MNTSFFEICFVQISSAAVSAAVELFICLHVFFHSFCFDLINFNFFLFHSFFSFSFALDWIFPSHWTNNWFSVPNHRILRCWCNLWNMCMFLPHELVFKFKKCQIDWRYRFYLLYRMNKCRRVSFRVTGFYYLVQIKSYMVFWW